MSRSYLVLLALVLSACSVGESSLIVQGKTAYLNGQYQKAADLFELAADSSPDDPEALFGRARSLEQLGRFEEAIPAYENALEAAPDDPRIQHGYVEALSGGGRVTGDRRLLRRSVSVVEEILAQDPTRLEVAWEMKSVLRELPSDTGYVDRLRRIRDQHGAAPLLTWLMYDEQIGRARRAQDSDRVEDLRGQLRSDLAKMETADGNAGALYFQAKGYALLGDTERAESAYQALERDPDGENLANWFWHRERFYPRWFEARRNGDARRQLELARTARSRYPPTWETGTARTDFAYEQLSKAFMAVVRQDSLGEDHSLVDSLLHARRRTIQLENWKTRHYADMIDVLIDQRLRLDTALAWSREARRRIESNTPGMISPFIPEEERGERRTDRRAQFLVLEARALEQLDRPEESDSLMARALDLSPSRGRYETYGRFLLDRGQPEQGVQMLLSALALGYPSYRADEEERVRQLVRETDKRHEVLTVSLDRAIDQRRAAIEDKQRAQIIGGEIGEPAPSFSLMDLSGRTWSLEDLNGKVAVLNFWASWCAPCIQEMPHFNELAREYSESDDVILLAIAVQNNQQRARRFARREDYSFPVLIGDPDTGRKFDALDVPAHVFVGPDGNVQYRSRGFPGRDEFIRETKLKIEALRSS